MMRLQATAVAGLFALSLGCVRFALADDEPDPGPPQNTTACAKVTASARYEGYGYTHVVELKNTCATPVQCQVWTDVDPDKQTLIAAPGEAASVVTRRGSPSRAVRAESHCKALR